MTPTRREFIQYVGTVLASLLTARCQRPTPTPMVTCYIVEPPTPVPGSSPTPSPHWATLRDCWLDLDHPDLQSPTETDFSFALRQRHAGALDALVSSQELDAAVAQEISVAFAQAIAHVQGQMATCYVALPPAFAFREDLIGQAAILEEMAAESDVNPATLSEIEAALERDITWLAQFEAGQIPGELEEIEPSPTSVQAARILVQLLLGGQE